MILESDISVWDLQLHAIAHKEMPSIDPSALVRILHTATWPGWSTRNKFLRDIARNKSLQFICVVYLRRVTSWECLWTHYSSKQWLLLRYNLLHTCIDHAIIIVTIQLLKMRKTLNIEALYWKIKILSRRKYNVDLKQEIHVIIQFKHSCPLEFSLRIWKLKYIKQ